MHLYHLTVSWPLITDNRESTLQLEGATAELDWTKPDNKLQFYLCELKRGKLGVWLSELAVCNTYIRGFVFVLLFSRLYGERSDTLDMFLLCAAGKRKLQWCDSGSNHLHKPQQEGTGWWQGGRQWQLENQSLSVTHHVPLQGRWENEQIRYNQRSAYV